MEQSATDRNEAPQGLPSKSVQRDAARVWTIGVPIALAVTALISSTSYYARFHPDASNEACLRDAANDPHAAYEAFFQNPPNDNARVQIERACAKRYEAKQPQ